MQKSNFSFFCLLLNFFFCSSCYACLYIFSSDFINTKIDISTIYY
nr:MAG TPA: hypothetical protein [Caudoviricetes sp.]